MIEPVAVTMKVLLVMELVWVPANLGLKEQGPVLVETKKAY